MIKSFTIKSLLFSLSLIAFTACPSGKNDQAKPAVSNSADSSVNQSAEKSEVKQIQPKVQDTAHAIEAEKPVSNEAVEAPRHNAPEQSKIDSIKAAKMKMKK